MQDTLYDYIVVLEEDLKKFFRRPAFKDILTNYPADRILKAMWDRHPVRVLSSPQIEYYIKNAVKNGGLQEAADFLNTLPLPRQKVFERFIGKVYEDADLELLLDRNINKIEFFRKNPLLYKLFIHFFKISAVIAWGLNDDSIIEKILNLTLSIINYFMARLCNNDHEAIKYLSYAIEKCPDQHLKHTFLHIKEVSPYRSFMLSFLEERERLYNKAGDHHARFKDLSRILHIDPSRKDLMWQRDQLYASRIENDDSVLDILSDVLSKHPDDVWAYEKRAAKYVISKNYTLALKDAEEIIRLKPDDSKGYEWRMECHSAIGNLEALIEDLKKIKSINPRDMFSYKHLVLTYGKLGQDEEALQVCSELVKLVLDPYWSYKERAQLYIKLGRIPEAMADLRELSDTNPHDLWALEESAKLHAKMGDNEALDKDIKEILRRAPQKSAVRRAEEREKIRILLEVGKPEEAMKIIVAAYDKNLNSHAYVSFFIDYHIDTLDLFIAHNYINEAVKLLDDFFYRVSPYFDFPIFPNDPFRIPIFNNLQKRINLLLSQKDLLNESVVKKLEALSLRHAEYAAEHKLDKVSFMYHKEVSTEIKYAIESYNEMIHSEEGYKSALKAKKAERNKILEIKELLEEVMREHKSKNPHVEVEHYYDIPLSYVDDILGKISQHAIDEIERWITERETSRYKRKPHDEKVIEWTARFIDLFKDVQESLSLSSKQALIKAYDLHIASQRQRYKISWEERHEIGESLRNIRDQPSIVLKHALEFIHKDQGTKVLTASEYVKQYGYYYLEMFEIFCLHYRFDEAVLLLEDLFSKAAAYYNFPGKDNDFFRLLFFNDLHKKLEELLKIAKMDTSGIRFNQDMVEKLKELSFKHNKYAYKANLSEVSRKHHGYFSDSVNGAIKEIGWFDKLLCKASYSAHDVVADAPSYFDPATGETYQDVMQLTQAGKGKVTDNYKRIGFFGSEASQGLLPPSAPVAVNHSNLMCDASSYPVAHP